MGAKLLGLTGHTDRTTDLSGIGVAQEAGRGGGCGQCLCAMKARGQGWRKAEFLPAAGL